MDPFKLSRFKGGVCHFPSNRDITFVYIVKRFIVKYNGFILLNTYRKVFAQIKVIFYLSHYFINALLFNNVKDLLKKYYH